MERAMYLVPNAQWRRLYRFFGLCTIGLGLTMLAVGTVVAQDETTPLAADAETTAGDERALLLRVVVVTADRAIARGAFEEAETLYREVLERSPDHHDAAAGLVRSLLRQGRTDEAMAVLQEQSPKHPGSGQMALLYARVHLDNQHTGAAFDWLAHASDLEPDLPDLDFYYGSALLQNEQPLAAYYTMCGASTSSDEVAWAQDLAIGAAFAQLGLEGEASAHFTSVYHEAEGTALADEALKLQSQLDESVWCDPRLRGSVKFTGRYDDNPGIVPTANVFGTGNNRQESAGHLYFSQFDYDLYRTYNFRLTGGYALYGTTNYDAQDFNLLDNAAYLAIER